MQPNEDVMKILDLMTQPSFCVSQRKILRVNPAAVALFLEPGADIEDLLCTGVEEYDEFSGGCLYLTLRIHGQTYSARVSKLSEYDVFQVDACQEDLRLQAMALAARELRNPLSSLMVCTDRLFPHVNARENPTAEELMARINRSLFQLLRTVGNMSDAGRYLSEESFRQEYREIGSIVRETFERAESLVRQSSITLDYTGLSAPTETLVDAERLERAILNLISNSVKFTPEGGHIRASLTRKGNKLCLSVSDDGSGILKGLEGQVFSSYRRDPQIEDGRLGIGLGMVLVCGVAAQHGGTVLVDHPQEKGTRVTMTLAIRAPSETQVRCPVLRVDYAGERDHALIELSDVLPSQLYSSKEIN